MINKTIRIRLLIALTCILASSFLLLSIINYKATRENIRTELLSSLPLTGETIYSEIHEALMRPMIIASLMAHDTFLEDWVTSGEKDLSKITKFLKEIKKKYDFVTTFFISAKTRNYYYSKGILKKVRKKDAYDSWYFDFIKARTMWDLSVDANQADNDALTVFLNFRVQDQKNKLLGVAGVGLKMTIVSKFLKKADEKYKRLAYLVAPDGTIQAHPDLSKLRYTDIHHKPGLGPMTDSILQPQKPPSNYEYKTNGNLTLVSVRYMPDMDCFLFVEQNVDAVLAAARNNFTRTIIVGLAVSVVVIIITLLTVNHFQLRLENMTRTDELTELANRREFESGFEQAVARHNRHGTAFSLILLDIDYFKRLNDTLGHLMGDNYLVHVARCIQKGVRATDLPARWGGDEFAVLVEGTLEDARAAAERIRKDVRQLKAPPELKGAPVTISCGVAQYEKDEDLDGLLARADNALYASKQHGRDRVST